MNNISKEVSLNLKESITALLTSALYEVNSDYSKWILDDWIDLLHDSAMIGYLAAKEEDNGNNN